MMFSATLPGSGDLLMTQRGMVRVARRIRLLALTSSCVIGMARITALGPVRRAGADPPSGRSITSRSSYGWWNADPTLIINSESLGIPGTDVDLVEDLGIEQKKLRQAERGAAPGDEAQVPLRVPADQVRSGDATLEREFIFNGQLLSRRAAA